KRLSDYDVFAKAGGAMRAVKETIRVTVSDGVLNLYFAKGLADNPLVSAIEVTPAAVAAREGAPEAGTEDWPLTLFPNPVRDQLTVTLPFPADQVRGTAVTDASGAVRLRNTHTVNGPQQLRLATGQLPKGLHLLRLDTENGLRVVKFVKQ
ncbi:MAG TPA: T9SS type A sorting domain-containing protein, partial [Cytophagales bacterium]